MAKRVEDLTVWQLARELRKAVINVSATGRLNQDFRLCSQVRSSAGSVVANIEEGFARFYPREFACFLRYAKASVAETGSHIADAYERNYISAEQLAMFDQLERRAITALTRLIRYLETCGPPPGTTSRVPRRPETRGRTKGRSG
jgi:four helix bundle protein